MRNERALILIFLVFFFFALLTKDGCMGRVLGSVAKLYSCLLCFDGSCPQVKRFLSVFGQTALGQGSFSPLLLQRELKFGLRFKGLQTPLWFGLL